MPAKPVAGGNDNFFTNLNAILARRHDEEAMKAEITHRALAEVQTANQIAMAEREFDLDKRKKITEGMATFEKLSRERGVGPYAYPEHGSPEWQSRMRAAQQELAKTGNPYLPEIFEILNNREMMLGQAYTEDTARRTSALDARSRKIRADATAGLNAANVEEIRAGVARAERESRFGSYRDKLEARRVTAQEGLIEAQVENMEGMLEETRKARLSDETMHRTEWGGRYMMMLQEHRNATNLLAEEYRLKKKADEGLLRLSQEFERELAGLDPYIDPKTLNANRRFGASDGAYEMRNRIILGDGYRDAVNALGLSDEGFWKIDQDVFKPGSNPYEELNDEGLKDLNAAYGFVNDMVDASASLWLLGDVSGESHKQHHYAKLEMARRRMAPEKSMREWLEIVGDFADNLGKEGQTLAALSGRAPQESGLIIRGAVRHSSEIIDMLDPSILEGSLSIEEEILRRIEDEAIDYLSGEEE